VGLSISGIELKRVLERYGWYVRRGGPHWMMAHPDRPGVLIPVERHRSDIAKGTLQDMLKTAGLTEEEVRKAR
jgi:predicted RNA binding protein YcfA (HicA-like mRNA interferase family)